MAAKSFPLSVTIARVFLTPFLAGVEGGDTLPADGRYIVAANHSSFMDGVVLAVQYAWLTKKPLHMISVAGPFQHPILGWFLRSSRCIPMDRKESRGGDMMIRKALSFLQMGEAVGIFPEGHVNNGRRMRFPRPGVALLALESGAPVVPIGITGSSQVLPLGESRPRLRRLIQLNIGQPLDFSAESREYHAAGRAQRTRLVQTVLDRIVTNVAPLADQGLPPGRRRRNRRK